MKSNNVTAKRIKEQRKRLNMTQEELAKKLHIKRQIISYYESENKSNRTPTTNDLIMLAKEFNITTDYLLGLTDVASADVELKTICEYTGLNENTVKLFHNYTDTGFVSMGASYWYPNNSFFSRIINIMCSNPTLFSNFCLNFSSYIKEIPNEKLKHFYSELSVLGLNLNMDLSDMFLLSMEHCLKGMKEFYQKEHTDNADNTET